MKLIQMSVKGISYSETQTGAYALILSESKGDRKLPVIIGGFEAQSIAIALEKEVKPSRPLTHDLFKSFAERFEILVKQVIIHKLVDGIFFSSIICERDKIEEIIDSRTSDAIALALRYNSPIYTYDSILEKAGFSAAVSSGEKKLSEDNWIENFVSEQNKKTGFNENLSELSVKKLKNLLSALVLQENYEKAARVRDELSKRKT
ncbi:MAG: bifunctional nuclease family protein [Flavobacteriaceae bacterium]|nr:bifunctional nuclease family protein [Flavobacteriaceae bacterium]